MSEVTCPRCGAPLGTGVRTSVACSGCRGVFVVVQQVASVVRSLEAGNVAVELGDAYRAAPVQDEGTGRSESRVRYLPCPFCSKPMNRKRLVKGLDLTVDTCTAHGVWFDGGELHRVASHLMSGNRPAQGRVDLGMLGRVSGIPPLDED